MACLGVEPGAAGWKAQTNPLSYGVTPKKYTVLKIFLFMDWLKSWMGSTGLDKSLEAGSWSLRPCTITMVDHIWW